MFKDVYVRFGDITTKQLHVRYVILSILTLVSSIKLININMFFLLLQATVVERSKVVLEEVALQLPKYPNQGHGFAENTRLQILTETLDQTLSRRPGKVVRAIGNA